MYEETTKGALSPMQTVADRGSNNVGSQTRTIAFLAVFLFAFSGLISGFAVGAFIHPKAPSTSNPGSSTKPPVVQKTQTPASTETTHPTLLGWPMLIRQPDGREIADGTTSYTLSMQVVGKTDGGNSGPPIHASGITSKIWLTKDSNSNANIETNNNERLKSVNTLSQPFPGEVVGALNFGSGSQQTQSSNADGQATWNYSIANSVDPGQYYLVILADWNGIHYNWDWISIIVKKAN